MLHCDVGALIEFFQLDVRIFDLLGQFLLLLHPALGSLLHVTLVAIELVAQTLHLVIRKVHLRAHLLHLYDVVGLNLFVASDLFQELVDLFFQEAVLHDEFLILYLVVIEGATRVLQLLVFQLHVVFHRCYLVVGCVQVSLKAFHRWHKLV